MASHPRRIGAWRVDGVLGFGGMGTVYLGHRGGRGAGSGKAAIKVIHPGLAHDAEFRQRFEREVAIARRVTGRYTAPVLDADVATNPPWYATEFVAGPTLLQRVTEHGSLSRPQVESLAVALVIALRDIHAVGVVHRDLKPGNVILAQHGPVVVDFGIAFASDLTAMTRTGRVLGSAGWMPPEQLEGRDTTAAVDVFAWAATVCFAATGRSPFGNTAAAAYRVLTEEPDLDGVPESLRGLLARALSREPGDRPTARALAEEVTSLVLGEDPAAPTRVSEDAVAVTIAQPWTTHTFAIPGDERGGRTYRRSPLRIAFAASAAIAISLLAGVLILNGPGPKADQSAAPVEASPAAAESAATAVQHETTPGVVGCLGGKPVIEPDVIEWACANANMRLIDIDWEVWQPDQGRGVGTVQANNCQPSCAAGSYIDYRTAVTVDHPVSQGRWFSRATITYLDGDSPFQDGRLVDIVDLPGSRVIRNSTQDRPEEPIDTSEGSTAIAPVFDAAAVDAALNRVPLNRDQAMFDDSAPNSMAVPPITQDPIFSGAFCGSAYRPSGALETRSSAGYGVEGWDSDMREIFGFATAADAIDAVSKLEGVVRACPYEASTGMRLRVIGEPVSGYPELAFTEWYEDPGDYPQAMLWHVMRVGAAVVMQVRGSYGGPNDLGPVTAQISDTANDLAPHLCSLTAAGC